MNKIVLIGRLTAKPELRYTNNQKEYSRFSIAINRNFTNEDGTREADFINLIAWGKTAINISNFFDKGNLIAIEGRLQTNKYEDNEGKTRLNTEVLVEAFDFLEKKAKKEDATTIEPKNEEEDPFATFGKEVVIDDTFLD